ncbi:hypothetical protein SteCoe_25203 [Stentor coeruleus]|uniref:Lysosomal dipeptide transporter MFSD1 n=1 Tax=Stentor coeruleus TaxID=5963 RepID=A0A1R2BFR3_9CILI|nr:hypothetical protein SteCoe_25203 [Stentor coeruleus]
MENDQENNNLKRSNIRYLALVLACLLTVGNFFVYDNPAVLQSKLESRLDISALEYNLFYSVYSIPNIFLPIFGGFIVDKIGNKVGNLIFASFIALGQGIFAIGVTAKSYPLAIVGRAVYGCGGESINVSQFNAITKWFSSQQLSISLSIIASVDRLSTAINDLTTPLLASQISLQFSLFFGFFICLLSLTSGIFLSFLDKKRKSEDSFSNTPSNPSNKITLKDIKNYKISFWLLCLNCGLVNSDVYCFNNIASSYFQSRFGYSVVESGRIISITFIISGLSCPIIGFFLDKYGKRIYFIMFSSFSITLTHCFFAMIPDSNRPVLSILCMVLLGTGFSVYTAVIWSTVPFLVPHQASATAFGIQTACYNLALVIFPICIGSILDNYSSPNNYLYTSFFFIGLGVLGIFSTFALYFANKKADKSLIRSNKSQDLEKGMVFIGGPENISKTFGFE